jgi:hypothetical protein
MLGKSFPRDSQPQFLPTPGIAPQPGPPSGSGGAAIFVPAPNHFPAPNLVGPQTEQLSKKLDAVLQRLEKLQAEVESLKK